MGWSHTASSVDARFTTMRVEADKRRGEGHQEGQHHAEQDATDAIDWALYADYAEVDEVIARIADDLALNT
jgi:hypothetical protein